MTGHLAAQPAVQRVNLARLPSRQVSTWYNRFALQGRVHLDLECTGLESVRLQVEKGARGSLSDLLQQQKVSSPRALFQRRDLRRPCRVCALAPALTDLFAHPPGTQPVTLALTSVPPERLGRDAAVELSDTGVERLRDLAGRFSSPLYASAFGPVAVFSTTRTAARLACKSLLGLWVPVHLPVDAEKVACAVALAADRHACGARVFSTPEGVELWRLAAAVCA